MIANFLKKKLSRTLNISSPSEICTNMLNDSFKGFEQGLNSEVKLTEEEMVNALIRMEGMSRNVFLLDKYNYEDYP